MGENTKIEWADHTWNPWVGCTKVGPPCDHCYAESWAKRTGHPELWKGERRRTTAQNWQLPLKWNEKAKTDGVRRRVFCASLADVFDNQVPERWRDDLWHRIEQTPHLDWLLLTKRAQNILKMLPNPKTGTQPWGDGWPNVWLGITCGDQPEYDRDWPKLRKVAARVRFISYEPALGPLLPGMEPDGVTPDWIIAGGESGGCARPPHPQWFRDLRDDCEHLGIAFLFKQWGEFHPQRASTFNGRFKYTAITVGDRVVPVHDFQDGFVAARVGKKAAGRLLDGREHNDFPKVAA